MNDLSPYDRKALKEIRQYTDKSSNFMNKIGNHPIVRKIGTSVDNAKTFAQNTSVGKATINVAFQATEVMNTAVKGVVDLLNDAASVSIVTQLIHKDFVSHGHPISSTDDISRLSLEQIDKVIRYLDLKYKFAAAGEGALAGFAGLPGIAADIPLLLLINMRGIATYSYYYGFDITLSSNRTFALEVLGYGFSVTETSKQAFLANIRKITVELAKGKTWNELEKYLLVSTSKQIAEIIGERLTKEKLGQVLPYVGSFVGGGVNAYSTGRVLRSAFYLYRQRFLVEKYGPDILMTD